MSRIVHVLCLFSFISACSPAVVREENVPLWVAQGCEAHPDAAGKICAVGEAEVKGSLVVARTKAEDAARMKITTMLKEKKKQEIEAQALKPGAMQHPDIEKGDLTPPPLKDIFVVKDVFKSLKNVIYVLMVAE